MEIEGAYREALQIAPRDLKIYERSSEDSRRARHREGEAPAEPSPHAPQHDPAWRPHALRADSLNPSSPLQLAGYSVVRLVVLGHRAKRIDHAQQVLVPAPFGRLHLYCRDLPW